MPGGPKHHGLIRPGIRFVGAVTVSNGTLDLSAIGGQAEDFVVYSLGRTFATAPTKPADWNEIAPAFTSAAPCYRIRWWRYWTPGLTDPLPAENGRKRVIIYRGARLKSGSASLLSSITSTTAGHIPAAAPVVPRDREVAVYDLYCRDQQADLDPYAPSGSTKRYEAPNVVNGEIGGDSIQADGSLGTGWAQVDPTFTASTAFAALSYILEPRNS